MTDETKCPNCGEKASHKKVVKIDRKTRKPHQKTGSFLYALAGGLSILTGIILIVLFMVHWFYSVKTSGRPISLGNAIFILVFFGLTFGFGFFSFLKISAVSANIIRLYRFKCSKCKNKWEQWQTEGWEQAKCPKCGGSKVILQSLMVDPSGKLVKVDTLIFGLLGSLIGSFIIVFGLWISRVPLPTGSSRTNPLVFVGFGFLLLCWSLPMAVKYHRRKKQLTYVCFECDHQWLHEGKTK